MLARPCVPSHGRANLFFFLIVSLVFMHINLFWAHGLVDTANFCHMLSPWQARGYTCTIDRAEDKAPMFRAVECNLETGGTDHPLPHAAEPGPPTNHDHYAGNKAAVNLTHPVLPDIGSCADLWPEYLQVILTLDGQVVNEDLTIYRLLDSLPRPVVLLHSQGNTSSDHKNLTPELQADLYESLLDQGGSLIVLDWDDRTPKLANFRCRRSGRLTVLELYAMMKKSDLLIAVDSGPLHFVRFCDLPALGLWTGHYPSQYVLPRVQTVNLVAPGHGLTRYRRLAYNIVEEELTGCNVAASATRMLTPRRYGSGVGPDRLLRHLVNRCESTTSLGWADRHITFDYFLRFLLPGDLVETGCIRQEEDFSAGMSTLLFGVYARQTGRDGRFGPLEAFPAAALGCRRFFRGIVRRKKQLSREEGGDGACVEGYWGHGLHSVCS
jgi:hypothetical protein